MLSGILRKATDSITCLLFFSPGSTRAVTLPKSTLWFICSLLPSPPLFHPSAFPGWLHAALCCRGLTPNTRHTYSDTQQPPHQVWLIWLVTHVNRAITSIQMLHSPLVCTPLLHTLSVKLTCWVHTCFHPSPLPPVVEDVMWHVACCCFDYFYCASLSSLRAVTARAESEETSVFSQTLAEIASMSWLSKGKGC